MFKNSFITRRIAYLSVLVGMSYILKSFMGLELVMFRFSFYDLPLFLTGIIFGPFYGIMAGFISDTLHIATPNNLAVGYNLMTVSSMMWGLMGGLFFYRKERINMVKLAIVMTTTSIMAFALISVQLYGPQAYGFFQLAPIPAVFFRIGSLLIKLPLQVLFIKIMFDRVLMQNEVYLLTLESKEQNA